jgi:hypothetical protein
MEKIDESAPALLTWDCMFSILLHCEIQTVMRVSATCKGLRERVLKKESLWSVLLKRDFPSSDGEGGFTRYQEYHCKRGFVNADLRVLSYMPEEAIGERIDVVICTIGASKVGKTSMWLKFEDPRSKHPIPYIPRIAMAMNFGLDRPYSGVYLYPADTVADESYKKVRVQQYGQASHKQSYGVSVVVICIDGDVSKIDETRKLVREFQESYIGDKIPLVCWLTKCDELEDSETYARVASLAREWKCDAMKCCSSATNEGVLDAFLCAIDVAVFHRFRDYVDQATAKMLAVQAAAPMPEEPQQPQVKEGTRKKCCIS